MRPLVRILFLGAWTVGVAGIDAGASGTKTRIHWYRDYELARNDAQLLERPMLIHVTSKWCPACLRLERTSFQDQKLIEFLNDTMVSVQVDIDRSPELAERFGVERLPVGLVLSTKGDVQTRIEGYYPADKYLAELTRILDHSGTPAKGPAVVRAATLPRPEPTNHQQLLRDVSGIRPASHTADTEPRGHGVELSVDLKPNLALDGCCTVSLLEDKTVVPGDPENSIEFDGQTYWFSTREQMEKFRADPFRFMPVFGGLCVATLVDENRESPGIPRYGAILRGRLYLFSGLEERQRFQANPKRYIDRDLTLHGHCPVCRINQGLEIQGLKELQHVHLGRVYQFDSELHRNIFLTECERYSSLVAGQ